MESVVNTARGYAKFEVTGARPEALLNLLSEQGIEFWGARPATNYVLRFTTRRADADRVPPLAARALCTVNKKSRHGAPELLFRLRRRVTLFLGFAAVLAALLWSSFHIWDIEVYGNENVSRAAILNALEECGVGIGSFWPDFVPDNIRSEVLVRVPELSYLTVNVYGSRAEVIVRERIKKPELVRENQPTDVIAEKAGIITGMRIYRGAAAAKVGQTVAPGDVLVSGEVVSPFAGPRRVHAMAEVQARTWYELTAVRPLAVMEKFYTGDRETRYALQIGGRRINFYANSGSGEALYDKIVERRPLSVGGLFTLPVTLVTERLVEYEMAETALEVDRAREALETELVRRLREKLSEDGEIVSTSFTVLEEDGLLRVTMHAECVENIAVLKEIK